MNKALCWKTDIHFTEGKEYNCTDTYGSMIAVLDNHNEPIKVGLDDPDFTFMLNVRTCDGCIFKKDMYLPECRECRISGKGNINNYSK
jgi:hypothetical protein